MTYYSKALLSDFEELKQLWNVVFDEEKTFLDSFFSKRFASENIFIARFNDKIVSALHALKATYRQESSSFDCSYIVGASTLQQYRGQGHMGKLLELTAKNYNHPITLFPAIRPYYEKYNYITTSSLLSFPLDDKTDAPITPLALDVEHLNFIYNQATSKEGSLSRDKINWHFLTDGYETVMVENGYAFIHENIAVETMATTKEAAKNIISLLKERKIGTIQVLKDSPFVSLLTDKNYEEVLMGMSTSKNMLGVYIAEQY